MDKQPEGMTNNHRGGAEVIIYCVIPEGCLSAEVS